MCLHFDLAILSLPYIHIEQKEEQNKRQNQSQRKKERLIELLVIFFIQYLSWKLQPAHRIQCKMLLILALGK